MAYPGGRRSVLVSILLVFFLSSPVLAQQITYEYDALGRLTIVTTPEGIAQYEYDAVGNILRIITRRYADVSGPVAILGMSPTKGVVGTTVHLYGRGFGLTPADNQIVFNGTPASVTAASASSLTVTVPTGATTGPVSLTAPQGSATTPDPFTVLQAFIVLPDQMDVVLGSSVGFQASLGGTPTTEITWRVNGTAGGSPQLGTITPIGVYTAPVTPPPVQPVIIEAVLIADPTQVATATVRVVGQAAGLIAAAPVSIGSATARTAQVMAGPVTVGAVQTTGAQVFSGPLTVGVTQPAGGQALSGPVTVAVTAAGEVRALGGPLSVRGGPVVTSVSPNAGSVGSAGLRLTLGGASLQGATAVRFLRNGLVDTTLSVSAIVPAADGSSVSCSLTISGNAAIGARVVQVVTPQGASTNFDLGGNLFMTQP
ncbi:MAG TPA: RHS repeat domain-containing protein [Candidatus Methylomirabilis sp.]|nr:RHS repeat domain-containing protein [Candidatus Methylomirabilis sp.]